MSANIKITAITSLIIFFLLNTINFSLPAYRMSIESLGEITNSSSIKVNVYIENVGKEFELTSYQCALSINQDIDLSSLSLSYIEESSELLNEPNLYVGIDNMDGTTELTFVSFIGNDIISSKTLVGTFLLEGNLDNNNSLNLQWNFDGTISTIITGAEFENITNPLSHVSSFTNNQSIDGIQKLNVTGVTASSTSDTNTSPEGTIDGKGYSDNDHNSRWATQSMPATLVFDLGEKKQLSKTRFSFFNFDKGRIYNYNVRVSDDKENWQEVLMDVSSKSEEWSEEEFSEVEGRYLELEFVSIIDPNNADWSNLWEAEIWGRSSSTSVEENEESTEEEALPSDYSISQNYPNPFNPSTKVQVRMRENGSVKLDVYNLLGERMLAVLDTELSAGTHEININASGLPSGVYIYRLNVANKFTDVKKMNLIK